jgi:hypothetical protein
VHIIFAHTLLFSHLPLARVLNVHIV